MKFDPELSIGPLHDPVTWYKIIYTGEQVAQWGFQNKGRCIVLEVPLCNLLTSIILYHVTGSCKGPIWPHLHGPLVTILTGFHRCIYDVPLPSKRLIHDPQLWVGWIQHIVNNLSCRRPSISHSALYQGRVWFSQDFSVTSAVNGCRVNSVRIHLQQMFCILQVTFWTAYILE